MPPSSVDELIRPNRTAPGCHLYFGAQDTEIHPGAIILLSGDDHAGHNTFQTAFSQAKNTTIHGGFYGIDATDEALEYTTSVAAASALQHLASRREALDLRRQRLAEMKNQQLASANARQPRDQKWLGSSLPSSTRLMPGYPHGAGHQQSQFNDEGLYRLSHGPTYPANSLPQNRNMRTYIRPDLYNGDGRGRRRGSAWSSNSLAEGTPACPSQNYSSGPHHRRQMYGHVQNADFVMAQGRGEAANVPTCLVNSTPRENRTRRGM